MFVCFCLGAKAPYRQKQKKVSVPFEKVKKKNMFRQKKLNRFLYRNVRAISLYNTNTVERNMAHLLLSCSQIFFWNWSRTEKNIGVFKSMRLILCERKHLNIGFHPYPNLYAGILFHDFRRNISRTEKSKIWKLASCGP